MINDKTLGYIYNQRRQNKYTNAQRRNPDVDIPYGSHKDYGSGNVSFDLPISRDLAYWSRFDFKLRIKDMVVPVSSGGASVTIQPTTISIKETELNFDDTKKEITPKKHTHQNDSHTHTATINLGGGTSGVPSSINDFKMFINGIDITPYLKLQATEMGGSWVNGNGLFPVNSDPNDMFYFDILDVTNFLPKADAETILSPGLKTITLQNNGVFGFDFIHRIKHSHRNS